MRRRDFLRLLAFGAAVTATTPLGADPTDDVTRQLRAQGFRIREVSRTLLGRVQVVAERGRVEREIVFDRITGEVRRDLVTEKQSPDGGRSGGGGGNPGNANRGGGRGGGNSGDSGNSGNGIGRGNSGNGRGGGNSGNGRGGGNNGNGRGGGNNGNGRGGGNNGREKDDKKKDD
jgi:hypothetical protein